MKNRKLKENTIQTIRSNFINFIILIFLPLKNFLILLLIVTLFGCAEERSQSQYDSSEMNTIDIQAELASIEETRAAFELAIKEKRYEDLGQLATPDFIGVSPGSEDWMEYKRLREEPFGQFSYDSIIMQPQETIIVSDTVAYDFGTSSVYYTNEHGEPVKLEDTFLVILKKDKNDGKWRIHREVASAVVE
jgi:ketosteroid isomerase-like protein